MDRGELYRLSDKDHGFSVLDPYEGYNPQEAHPTEFRRGRVPVSLDNGEVVNAWVYLYCQTVEGLKPKQTYLKFSLEFAFRESDKHRFVQRRKASKAINRRFTQMDTKGTALSAWRKALN